MQSSDNSTVIEFDVYAVWYKTAPAYRIYVDGQLMTERTFLGTEGEFYRERISVDLTPGEHACVFEKLPTNSIEDRLTMANFKVNGNPAKPNFTIE